MSPFIVVFALCLVLASVAENAILIRKALSKELAGKRTARD